MASHSVDHDEGGDGYFASVSDLMVGILFVFLLMLAVFALAYSDPVTENDAAAMRQRIMQLEAERDALRGELTTTTTALTTERNRSATLTFTLDASQREVARLTAELDRLLRALAALQARVVVLTDERAKALSDLAQERARAAALSSDLEAALVEIARLHAELVAQGRALTESRGRAALLEQQLASATSEMLGLRAQLERLMALVNPRERELFQILLSDLLLLERDLKNLSDEGRLQSLRRELLERLQERLRGHRIEVQISPQNDVLRLPSEELFVFGFPTFTPTGRDRAMRLLEEIATLLPCFARGGTASDSCPEPVALFETILIEGHTDTIRGDNWRLSTSRALAVLDLMVGPLAGLRELRNSADQPLIGLAGYGESRTLPGIAGTDARNRRIELRFLLAAPSAENLAALRARVAEIRIRLDELQGRR